MADISVTPKEGGSRSWLWAIVAIVLMAALMFWLHLQEGTTSPTPVVEEDTTAAAVGDTLPADTAAAVDTATADTAAQ